MAVLSVIEARNLTMTYRAPVRDEGLRASLRALIRPQYREVEAVRGVTFDIAPGEVVGFIGPNGAGKTTTLKMLSGILHPSSGTARVLGHDPSGRHPDYLRRMAMIRGSRPLAAPGDITVLDALRFQQAIYRVAEEEFAANLKELSDMLELEPLLTRQVRALSLGEKMRAGLAWSLLYRPRVLFLDEPTLGLDVVAVAVIRQFIADYAARTGATIMLTSHYMADVEQLCPRVLLIDHGRLVYDGSLAGLTARLAPHKLVKVTLVGGGETGAGGRTGHALDWHRLGSVVSADAGRVVLQVPRPAVKDVVARLLADAAVGDLGVEEPPLEAVIGRVYREGVGEPAGDADRAEVGA